VFDRLEVGHHAAEPAAIDVGHAAGLRSLANGVARGTLGAHEQDRAVVGSDLRQEIPRVVHQRHGLFQIEDMDLVAFAEDVGGHLRAPIPGLVTEMDARLEHLAHRDTRHGDSFVSG